MQWLVFFRANEGFGKLGSSLPCPALPLHSCLKSLNDNVIALAENFSPCQKNADVPGGKAHSKHLGLAG